MIVWVFHRILITLEEDSSCLVVAYILCQYVLVLKASHIHQKALEANKPCLEGEVVPSPNVLISLVVAEDILLLVVLNASYASACHYCALLVNKSLLLEDKD